MRIGIDARLTHYRQAGISQYILQLIEGLARCEAQDEFTILQSYKSREPILSNSNFAVRRLLTPSHHRFEQFTLPLELSTMGLDVLHSPDSIPPFRRNCRSVITIHDLAFLLYPHLLTKDSARYYSQIDQAVQHTDAIIAVSQATKNDIVRLLGVSEHKITVIYEAASPIYRPIRSPELSQRVRGRFGIPGDFVLFMSTIEPRKNVPNLLRAFRQLLNDYHLDIKLVLAGEKGWLFEDVFRLMSELDLLEDVIFLGRVSSEELLWLYNTAQLLVAPSIYEGFGLTPLEAMACGTPVVVSNVSSFPEVVGDAGILVDPNNVDEITVGMWRALSDSKLRECLIEKGLKRAATFSWDKAAAETLELYHSLA
ncbi:MAG: glycosyltransferase family 4 protein [Chloroflexi bacterium]|jgi:glycosyltransferase involved in cell wall biosynthesis|nr:glycosyltransferase family 4 protein [Chloroflexota bacterium]